MSRLRAAILAAMVLTMAGATVSAQWRGFRGERGRDRDPVERTEDGRDVDRGDASGRTEFEDAYGILVEQNIFIRQRGQREMPTWQPSTQPVTAARTPEQSLMLTGIVIEEGELRAYFENLNSGTVQRVALGEAIGRGQVVEIMIDAVAYAGEASVHWVEIGHDLTGTPAVTATTAPTTETASEGSAPGGAAPGTAEPADPSLMSAAERMRARARQLRGEE